MCNMSQNSKSVNLSHFWQNTQLRRFCFVWQIRPTFGWQTVRRLSSAAERCCDLIGNVDHGAEQRINHWPRAYYVTTGRSLLPAGNAANSCWWQYSSTRFMHCASVSCWSTSAGCGDYFLFANNTRLSLADARVVGNFRSGKNQFPLDFVHFRVYHNWLARLSSESARIRFCGRSVLSLVGIRWLQQSSQMRDSLKLIWSYAHCSYIGERSARLKVKRKDRPVDFRHPV